MDDGTLEESYKFHITSVYLELHRCHPVVTIVWKIVSCPSCFLYHSTGRLLCYEHRIRSICIRAYAYYGRMHTKNSKDKKLFFILYTSIIQNHETILISCKSMSSLANLKVGKFWLRNFWEFRKFLGKWLLCNWQIITLIHHLALCMQHFAFEFFIIYSPYPGYGYYLIMVSH